MSKNINPDEHIQRIYNKTKNLKSPSELDDLILGKIRHLEDEPITASADSSWIYLPIAASILLAVFLQFKSSGETEPFNESIETAQLPTKNKPISKQENIERNKLPEMFFIPHEDINSKIVPACDGQFLDPDGVVDQLIAPDSKSSDLPIRLIYPNDISKEAPECDRVSKQIFKKGGLKRNN